MKVFLDAGHNHSGEDTGAQGNGLKEQDITYQIAQKVGARLRNQGILVKYSRDTITSNIGKTLSESINGRVKMANDWKADLFISIHCNAFGDSAVSGTETLVYSLKSGAALLAKMVNSNLSKMFASRGVKERPNLGVLRGTSMTAILVEVGFITNPANAQILTHRQDDIAQAIVEAVFEYTGIEHSGEAADMVESEETKMIYNYIDNNTAKIADDANECLQHLVDKGILKGNEKGELNLTLDMIRIFLVHYRVGLYD